MLTNEQATYIVDTLLAIISETTRVVSLQETFFEGELAEGEKTPIYISESMKIKLEVGIQIGDCILKITPYLESESIRNCINTEVSGSIVEWQERLEEFE
ncbi:MAG: hypothetical protein HC930_02920 [Hydrococcus sp. SU_1_0]|nr:hypothetical protein [Hydrococcus sp. SU_1_0]